MKTIFDDSTREQLIQRINTLNENSTPQWGKMNIYQMLKHCNLAEAMYLGQVQYKRMFLGRILGQWVLKNMLKNDEPMRRNAPTSDAFKIQDTTGDIEAEKNIWIAQLEKYATFDQSEFVHWFFGKMTKEQIGQLVYKHADHHLRQFNS